MRKLRTALTLVSIVCLNALAAATVDTQLSADETSVGGMVQLQVRVDGTTNVSMPGKLDVDGLDIRLTGRSTQVQIVNGAMSTAGVYSYSILPMREGTFEIPSIEIAVDGVKQKTPPQKLVVQPGVAPRSRPMPTVPAPPAGKGQSHSSAREADGRLAFAKVLVPKKSIYAGEVVPVEVLFYFASDENNPRARVQFRKLQDVPTLSGEGFTAQKLAPPTQSEELVGDINYVVLTYKTSITAVKSGDMMTPKASFEGVLGVPADGPPDMNGLFNQFFGGQGMPGFMDEKQVTIESEPEPIHVKALPSAGRPADFSGAIGDFTITASADPLKTAPGDPVTLKVAVSGRGNFDAMDDPKLADTTGWRAYPPTSKFEPSDLVGFSGTKNFEMPLLALQPQSETPVAAFSYFDPDKSQYFTLATKPVAIEAAASPAAPQATAASSAAATPTPEPAPVSLGHLKPRSWQPVLKQPIFWILNAAAAAAVIAIFAATAFRRASQGAAGRRAARRRDRDRAIAELGRGRLAGEKFYATALDALSIQAGLSGAIGPFELVRALEAEGRDVRDLQILLACADEIKFSGGAQSAARLDEETRGRILRALKEACR